MFIFKTNMNTINIRLLTSQQPLNFTGLTSKHKKKEYKERLANNTILEKNINNLQQISKCFEKEGLTYNDCLKACKSNLFLLIQKPSTIEKNIRSVIPELSKYGLTTEKYLECAKRYPMLFSLSPETIVKNVNNSCKIFEIAGLTGEKYITAGMNNPVVFIMKPQKLRKKINKITENINVSRKDIITMFLKQPSLFNCNEDEIIKKYKILKYIEENKFFDKHLPIPDEATLKPVILRKSFTNSVERNYLILLRNKIVSISPEENKIPFRKLKDSLIEYMHENKKNVQELTIPDGEFARDFIKFINNFCKSVIGNNIFKIAIV